MTLTAPRPWPVELKVSRVQRVLAVTFDDGQIFDLPAEYLRVMTPSAADRGHGAGPRPALVGKDQVNITDLRLIGTYAVRIVFDDGHDTGLYSWDALYRLGQDRIRS